MHADSFKRLLIITLTLLAGAFALIDAAEAARNPAMAPNRAEVKRMVMAEARQAGIPIALALAVAKVESNFNSRALSSAGARGVMQIMPKTGRDLYGVEADQLWDAELNIRLGVDFLKNLHGRYGRWDLALSHYNGGSRVGTPPNARVIPATRKYVNAVLAWQRRYDRNATVVAMTRAEENLDRSAAEAPTSARANRYWMYDRPNVEQDWRHYLRVADQWLDRSRRIMNGERVDPVGPSIDPVPSARAPSSSAAAADPYAHVDPWAEAPTVESAPASVVSGDVRQRFRNYLSTGRLPWLTHRDRMGGAARFGG